MYTGSQDLQAVQLLQGGSYISVPGNGGWQQNTTGAPGRQVATAGRAPSNVVSVPMLNLNPISGQQVTFIDGSTGNLLATGGSSAQQRPVSGPQPGRPLQLMVQQGQQLVQVPGFQTSQQQQQQQQQTQMLQLQQAPGGAPAYKLNTGTRVVKAGQPYPNTTIVQTVALPTNSQPLSIVGSRPQHVMMTQQQPINALSAGPGGVRSIPVQMQAPSSYQTVAMRPGGPVQVQVQGPTPVPIPLQGPPRNPNGTVQVPISVQTVYATQASNGSLRTGVRIPKMGTVATYNPVTGVRSATAAPSAGSGSSGSAGGVPVLPAGLPASLVQQVHKVNMLQQQHQEPGLQGLGPNALQQQQQQAQQVRTLVSGMNISMGPGVLGSAGSTGGSQRQTTILVGSGGFGAPPQGSGLGGSSGGQQQVVNITLPDGTTATTVMDQATLLHMLNESALNQAVKQQQSGQRLLAPPFRLSASVDQLGGLQPVHLGGSQVPVTANSAPAVLQPQQSGMRPGGRPPPPPPPPITPQQQAMLQAGMPHMQQPSSLQMQQQRSMLFNNSFAGPDSDAATFNAAAAAASAMLFADSSTALAQLQGLSAGGQQGPTAMSSQGLGGMNVEGLSLVDLNALLDNQQAQQQQQQQQHFARHSLPAGSSSVVGRSSSFASSQFSTEDIAALGGAAPADDMGVGLGLNMGMGLGLAAGASSQEDLKAILVSIGQELARHCISVETAVTSGWLGVLTGQDVGVLAEAYSEEERRLAQHQQQHQQEQLQAGQELHQAVQQSLASAAQQAQAQQQAQGGQPGPQLASASSLGPQFSERSSGAGDVPSSGARSGSGPQAAMAGASDAGAATIGGSPSGGDETQQQPLGEQRAAGSSGTNDRPATAAILALTSSSGRTALAVTPSEDGNNAGGDYGGGPLEKLPAQTAALGLCSGTGSSPAAVCMSPPPAPHMGAAARPAAAALGGQGASFNAFQYGFFGPGGGAGLAMSLGLGLGEQSLSADHERMSLEPLEASEAGPLAEMFGEKPWPRVGMPMMADEVGLSARAPRGTPPVVDSASEYEARCLQAAAAASRAASTDNNQNAAAGKAVQQQQPQQPVTGPAAGSVEIPGNNDSSSNNGEKADAEMLNRFANLDLGCGFY